MKTSTIKTLCRAVLIGAAALSAACGDHAESPATPVVAQPTVVEPGVVESWLGRWTGPEGTFLDLSRAGDRFDITIQNLDGPAHFVGKAVGERIEFERDGKTESIRATNGPDTGMKWLQDKTDCLTVHPGEGYCRN